MKHSIKIAAVLILQCLSLPGQNKSLQKTKIEIYFLKNEPTQSGNDYFLPTAKDLADTAFIHDNEIIGYGIYPDSFHLTRQPIYVVFLNISGKQKLATIKNISLCCGKRFAMVLNDQPVYGAYLWNDISSFGCSWLTAFSFAGNISISKGLPEDYFDKTRDDPRNNKNLLNAFKISGRLIEH